MAESKSTGAVDQLLQVHASDRIHQLAETLQSIPAKIRDHGETALGPLLAKCDVGILQRHIKSGAKNHIARVGRRYAVDELANISGRFYPSAHEAAVKEADRLLVFLMINLDPQSLRGGDLSAIETEWQADMDVEKIAANWPAARATFEGALTPQWEADFAAIPSRIVREIAVAGSSTNTIPLAHDHASIVLDDTSTSVLIWLSKCNGSTSQEKIANRLNTSRATVKTCLEILRSKGLAETPTGRSTGVGITSAGQRYLESRGHVDPIIKQ